MKFATTTLAALGALGLVASAGTAAACSAEDWKSCAGKSWVDGGVMDTPLGSKGCPNPLWGEGDEGG